MMRPALLAAIVALAACDSGAFGSSPSPARADGAALFATHCARCHGESGRGDGTAAEYLFPRPRDFAQARYKIRTTPSGQLPTDEDLLGTIKNGLPGSAMPSFAFLTGEEQRALIAHLKTLAVVEGQTKNRFELVGPGTPVKVGDEPAPDLARGRKLYETMSCFKCHGDTGEGDGPSAPTLVDDNGFPAPPNNFTRGLFKGGATARDVYLRFTTGMSGTPMPSFVETLKDGERWALAHYVGSLVKKEAREVKYESFKPIEGKKVERVPLDPADGAWAKAPGTEIALMTLWQRLRAPTHVVVRVLHDGKELGVCVEWDDAGTDGAMLAPQLFSDGAAVMFSLTKPFAPIQMGDKDHPVNVWHWRFDRQIDMAEFQDLDALYPGNVNDGYFCDPGNYPPTTDQKPHLPLGQGASLDKLWLSGWGAGNPVSEPLKTTPVQDLNAFGFGTLEAQPADRQNVEGKGVWIGGRWRVVFRRPLASDFKMDAPLAPGSELWMAFAVWDGAAGDRANQKSITFWQTVKLP